MRLKTWLINETSSTMKSQRQALPLFLHEITQSPNQCYRIICSNLHDKCPTCLVWSFSMPGMVIFHVVWQLIRIQCVLNFITLLLMCLVHLSHFLIRFFGHLLTSLLSGSEHESPRPMNFMHAHACPVCSSCGHTGCFCAAETSNLATLPFLITTWWSWCSSHQYENCYWLLCRIAKWSK